MTRLCLALGCLGLSIGCGGPTPVSVYVPMTDGTELAVDVWLPSDVPEEGAPAVLKLGRYWRDYQLPQALPVALGKYPDSIGWLNAGGYAVIAVDVRGTGASFGVSTAPWSPLEVADFTTLVDWTIAQPWSNGKVGGTGVSYEGVTADWLAAIGHPAVKAIVPTYSYSDVYQDVSHPGGIFNERFVKAWADVTAKMDRNDPTFLDVVAAANPKGWIAIFVDALSALLLGVQPVTGAGELLADALTQHQQNSNVFESASQIEFRDDLFADVAVDHISPLLGAATHQRTAAIRRVVGWQDAGTARGALRSFNTLDAAYHVLVIAPETHTGNYRADPYDFGEAVGLDKKEVRDDIWRAVEVFDAFVMGGGAAPLREVQYYTYVERVWQHTPVWPPAGFDSQRWHLAADGRLSRTAPTEATGEDAYVVDFDATTGLENRWFSGLSGVPIRYPDRAEQDQRLLVYETPPLEQNVELTGHPLVSLQLKSTDADGAVYVYVEDVGPDEKVVYVTEGQLRLIHRKVSSETPPSAIFGPYHTCRRADAEPPVPDVVCEVSFDLLPISTIIRTGHRVRVAIAGHDKDTFVRYPAEGTPTLTFSRNAAQASWIELPVRPRPDLALLPDEDRPVPRLALALCPSSGLMLLLVPLAFTRRQRLARGHARRGL